MRYTGRLFYPRGARLELDLAALSPIQGHVAYELYARFKREMDAEEFDARIDAGGDARAAATMEPVFLRFSRVGQTAAYVAFARGGGGGAGDDAGDADDEARELRAVMALLARLDRDEDDRVIDELSGNAHLAGIDDEDWDAARGEANPVAATFFADGTALNDPLLHGLMSLAGAAFFDRLGLLS